MVKNIILLSALIFGFNMGGSAQTTINLPAAQNCAPAGVTDTDNDGIPNKIDKCPADSGVYAMQGCPVPSAPTSVGYSFNCDHDNTAVVDVSLSDGSVWMDRNLGALHQAYDEIDLFGAGCLYQYGRKPDGHQMTHYYQPPNWLNGYPNAANTLSDGASSPGATTINGYDISPTVGGADFNASLVFTGGTPAGTYFSSNGSPSPAIPSTPTSTGFPARTNIGTYIYSNYSWYSDIATYPLETTLPTLWGGNVGYYDGTALPLAQAWGTELNPVCPTGYHVPTIEEWTSALRSIYITDGYRGQWGTSKLHLTNSFNSVGSGAAYWTSTQNTTGPVATHYTVVFNTDYTQNNSDRIDVGTAQTRAVVYNMSPIPMQCTASLFVRCKKN